MIILQKIFKKNTQEKIISEPFINKIYSCKFCYKKLSNRISKWRHENKTCRLNVNLKNTKETINNTTINNNTTNNNITNNIQNIQNNIVINFNGLGKENVLELTQEEIEEILGDGLNSVTTLIKLLNFNKNLPENHTFCTTSLSDKYLSALNIETNEIEKHRKIDYFDKVLLYSIAHLNILNDNILDKKKKSEFIERISKVEELIYKNGDHKKIYLEQINMISYNKKNLIRDTWNRILFDKVI